MELGLVGKPNVGKSTFFSAVTEAPGSVRFRDDAAVEMEQKVQDFGDDLTKSGICWNSGTRDFESHQPMNR